MHVRVLVLLKPPDELYVSATKRVDILVVIADCQNRELEVGILKRLSA
jgi:hypothetical protein